MLVLWEARPSTRAEVEVGYSTVTFPRVECANREKCVARVAHRRMLAERRSKKLVLAEPANSAAPRGQCRWCDKPIWWPGKPGVRDTRRNYHYKKHGETDCKRAWEESRSWDARAVLKRRDKGVCAQCGHDCEAARLRFLRVWSEEAEPRSPFTHASSHPSAEERRREEVERHLRYRAALEKFGEDIHWHADHIVAVVDGGDHTLDNLQTLCLTCHNAKTAEEVRERARKRRAVSPDQGTLLSP